LGLHDIVVGLVVAMCDELWRMDTQLAQKAQLDAYTMGTPLDLRRPERADKRGTPKVNGHDFTLWSINGVTLFRSL